MVSTGTWVIVCAPGADLSGLDPARDFLANIDAFGRPVASARFMGGREFSLLIGEGELPLPSSETIARVLGGPLWLLPSVVEGSGPFPHSQAHWSVPRAQLDRETQYVVASFYLALMTAECLRLAGAEGDVVVEGPFATNGLYLEMLAAATDSPVVPMHGNSTGTSIGAALLAAIDSHPHEAKPAIVPRPETDLAMRRYAARWRQAVATVRAA